MVVLHHDIKPSNVLWDGEKPLLADFALSKIKDQLVGATDATVAGMTSALGAAGLGVARLDQIRCLQSRRDAPAMRHRLRAA